MKRFWLSSIRGESPANDRALSFHSDAVEDFHANTHATSMVKTMTKGSRTGNGVPSPATGPAKSWQTGNTSGELEAESELWRNSCCVRWI